MSQEEFKELENLLGKLQSYIGGKRCCIVPNYVQDGYSIGVYDLQGAITNQAIGATIKETADKIKNNHP